MTKCDTCKVDLPVHSAHREAPGRILLREKVSGETLGYIYYGGADGAGRVETACAKCDGARHLNEAGRWAVAKARDAGLSDGRILEALGRDAAASGVEKALLRAIADVLHDARPVGNNRTEAEWKRVSTAQAVARRLAEIGAAPR